MSLTTTKLSYTQLSEKKIIYFEDSESDGALESACFFSGDVLMDAVEEAVTNQKTHQFLDFILRETKPYTLNKLMRFVSLPSGLVVCASDCEG